MKIVFLLLLFIFPINQSLANNEDSAALNQPSENLSEKCHCDCPSLRQHTWQTLKQAWQKGKGITEEQWQEFLRWRQQRQKERSL